MSDEELMMFFFKQKTAYEMRISDWSSDVCSSDLRDILVLDFACDTRIGRQRAARNRRFPVAAPRKGLRDLPLPPARAIDQRAVGCVNRDAAGAGIVVDLGDRKSTRLNSSH